MESRIKVNVVVLVLIFILAAFMRISAVNQTIVDYPLRADAGQYFAAAYNLKYLGIYSSSIDYLARKTETVEPDAYRPPVYSLFLLPFIERAINDKVLLKITLSQAILSFFLVVISYGIYKSFLPKDWALFATLLTAICPHLITINTYILTESLYTFLLVSSIWLISKLSDKNDLKVIFIIGILIALAALTRSTLLYFIIPLAALLFFHYGIKRGTKVVMVLFLGYGMTLTPWYARNITTLGIGSDPTLKINTLHHGMYPGLMYKNNPDSLGIPYRYDPNTPVIGESSTNVINEIKYRFTYEPWRHIKWYLIGKPIVFLQWHMSAGMKGINDTFIYPTPSSPYLSNTFFKFTNEFMRIIHWPLVIMSIIASILIWLPSVSKQFTKQDTLIARVLSLIIFYYIVIHMIGAPFPRYNVPIRPLIHGMAIFGIWLIFKKFKKHENYE